MDSSRAEPRILVVEDDADIREAIVDVLEARGYRVVTAANGQEGLARLREGENPDLILLDLMMPVMDGTEFLASLRGSDVLTTVPIVLLSAWSGEAGREVESMTAGFVKKPVTLDTLLEVVERFCPPGGERTRAA
jgi:CheY-like chemotaxis protein